MEERVLNINGRTKVQLQASLAIAFMIPSGVIEKASGFCTHPDHGLLFFRNEPDEDDYANYSAFTPAKDMEECNDLAWTWVRGHKSRYVPTHEECNVDLSSCPKAIIGWEVYYSQDLEESYSSDILCAIRPFYFEFDT